MSAELRLLLERVPIGKLHLTQIRQGDDREGEGEAAFFEMAAETIPLVGEINVGVEEKPYRTPIRR